MIRKNSDHDRLTFVPSPLTTKYPCDVCLSVGMNFEKEGDKIYTKSITDITEARKFEFSMI